VEALPFQSIAGDKPVIVRAAMFGLMILGLTGCATVPPPSLGVGELQRYRIADVAVEGVEGIRSWPAEEDAFASTNAVDAATLQRIQTEPAANHPPLRAHIQRVLVERFRAEFAAQLGGVLAGPRPLKAVVRLKEFDVPSAARRVFVGGHARIQATIELVDPATGAAALRYEGPAHQTTLVNGLATGLALALNRSDVGRELITESVTAYRNWLLRN